jgi:hypothetical protein
MYLLKVHLFSFRLVVVAYAMSLKRALALRRIDTASEVEHGPPLT